MDFMKILDQTVREIKREVNLKVLKVPEIEQKVLDATNDEPWGPHGSALSEIAQATKNFTDCHIVINVLWNRLTDAGPNWRHVYKALAVIEYLVSNGAERAVDDILEHISQIGSLSSFEYVEPNGKDVGINVRKKAETILSLLSDREKIQAAREKAAANRDKYFGLSSTGISYKSSSASYGFGGSYDSYRGGLSGGKEGEPFKGSYKDRNPDDRDNSSNYQKKDDQNKSRESKVKEKEGLEEVKKGSAPHVRDQDALKSSATKAFSKPASSPSKSSGAQPSNVEDDFDDFDPRGLAASGSAGKSSKQVDLFGQNLVDLMDVPPPIPTQTTTLNHAANTEVDLFADATFVSASPQLETSAAQTQGNVDLFTSQSASTGAISPNIDFFASPNSGFAPVKEPSKSDPTNTHVIDPFSAVPLNGFEESDGFGAFTSHSDPVTSEPFNTSYTKSPNQSDEGPSSMSKSAQKKDTFQVKSGIWAASLSRGLIDLNITAPKKVSLADVGIVGDLGEDSDVKEKAPPLPAYMGRAMGTGSGLGWSVPDTSSAAGGTRGLSIFDQQQFGSFKK